MKLKKNRTMHMENVRGYDKVRHKVDNLTDNGAKNVCYYFDADRECYIVTWEEINNKIKFKDAINEKCQEEAEEVARSFNIKGEEE